MNDKILEMFFDTERWRYAIEKGVGKHINKAHLYQLTKPDTRAAMYAAIRDGRYEIAPPHTALIPKDNGEFRTVYVTDPENFAERNRWFNRGVIVQMATDYIKLVRNIVTKLRIRSCKGVPYVRLDGTNIFIKDLRTKVYEPLEKLLRSIRNTRQPAALYRATVNFYKAVKETCLFFDMEQSRAFKDAYKGAGAFFTLKNLILFHDCGFPKMSQKMSREYLYELASQKDLEGYKLFGILKDFLVVNGINIEAMRAEWRK